MRAMWIKALKTKDFGILGSRHFSFSRGLNLVFGPNEAGKTTLFEAIEQALLGVPLNRDYSGSAEVLLVIEGREVWVGPKRGRPQILRLSKSLFESLYFVRTGELAFKGQRELLRDLKKRLLDVERLYKAMETIERKLGRGLKQLGVRMIRQGELEGAIEGLRVELEELERKRSLLEQSAEDLRRLKVLKEEQEGLKARMAELEQKEELLRKASQKRQLREQWKRLYGERKDLLTLQELRRQRESLSLFDPSLLRELKDLQQEAQGLQERLGVLRENLSQVEEDLRRKLRELEARGEEHRKMLLQRDRLSLRLDDLGRLEEFEGRLEDLRERREKALGEIEEVERKLQDQSQEVEALKAERNFLRRKLRLARWFIPFGILLLLAGILLLLGSKGPFLLGLGLAAGGFLGVLLSYRRIHYLRGLSKGKEEELRGHEERLQELVEAKRRGLEEIEQIGRAVREALGSFGLSGEEEFRFRLRKARETREGLRALEARIGELERTLEEGKREVQSLRDRKEKLEREIAEVKGALERIEGEQSRRLRDLGLSSLKELEDKVSERQAVEQKISLLEGKGVRSLQEVEREIAEVNLRLKELEDVPDEVEGGRELREALRQTKEELLGCTREISEIEGRLSERQKALGMGESELFLKLRALREELSRKERLRLDLFALYEIFQEVERRLDQELMELLRGRTREWFGFVVGERVKDIEIAGNDIRVVMDGRTLGSRELSSGTRDPLYFSARVAIAERVRGLRTLLLDDPFLTCDPERTAKMLEMIERLSSRFQIILATKDPWLRDEVSRRGATVIELRVLVQRDDRGGPRE